MTIPIAAWTLQGLINGEHVDVSGSGHIETTTGQMVLDITSEAPLPEGFDLIPACRPSATSPPRALPPAPRRTASPGPTSAPEGVRIAPDRIGRVHTEAGIEVLRLSAVTTLSLQDDGLHVDNMVHGVAHLPTTSLLYPPLRPCSLTARVGAWGSPSSCSTRMASSSPGSPPRPTALAMRPPCRCS